MTSPDEREGWQESGATSPTCDEHSGDASPLTRNHERRHKRENEFHAPTMYESRRRVRDECETDMRTSEETRPSIRWDGIPSIGVGRTARSRMTRNEHEPRRRCAGNVRTRRKEQ